MVVKRLEYHLYALGNITECNNNVALLHPVVDRDTKDVIGDVQGVEVFCQRVDEMDLVGSYAKFTN